MDRRRRRFSPSVSRSPPRHRSPERAHKRHSRSFSRSPSRSLSRIPRSHCSSDGNNGWTRERQGDRSARNRSVSRERDQHRETERERHMGTKRGRSSSRKRSTSRSVHVHVTTSRRRDFSHRRRSPNVHRQSLSPRRHSPSPRHHLLSPRRRLSHVHVRRHVTRSRSTTPRRRSRSNERCHSLVFRHDSSSPRRHRSSSTHCRSASSRGGSGSPQRYCPRRRRSPSSHLPSSRQCSPTPRRCSQYRRSSSPCPRSASGLRRRGRSPCRGGRSRSRSHSRWHRSQDTASQSSSSRGRSSSRNMERRLRNSPAAMQSSVAIPSSLADTSPKAGCTDDKQNESTKVDRVLDEHRTSTAGSHDHRGGNIHDTSYGFNHHQVHNHRPFQQDASSSTAMQGSSAPAKSIPISDRVTTSASTPTRPTGGANENQHTLVPVVNPVVEKMRQAQRESHRAYLKSNSDYNHAEMKYVSIEAELRLAEFWLEIMTKNLEDVGKRIEVHDWNFQKITGQDESNVA